MLPGQPSWSQFPLKQIFKRFGYISSRVGFYLDSPLNQGRPGFIIRPRQPSRILFPQKKTRSIPAGNGHLKASRPRLAPARPKVCARRVREPLRFAKQEPFPLSPLGGVRVLAQWISTGQVFMINPRAQ